MPKQGLASIGIEVMIGATKEEAKALNFVTNIGDIGGTPSALDATCLKDKIKKSVPGVQDTGAWECEYLFDNTDAESDYRVLKGHQDSGEIMYIGVSLADGSLFETKGYISTKVTGVGIDELHKASFSVSLQEDWEVTNPGDAEAGEEDPAE